MSDNRNDDAVEMVMSMAAISPDLDDDAFVMVARALRGQNPLTGETEPVPQPAKHFFVAVDGADDEALWEGVDSEDCNVVIYRFQLDTMHPVLWPTLVAALDGKPAAGGAAR